MTVRKNRMRPRPIQRSTDRVWITLSVRKDFDFSIHKTAEMQSERRLWVEMGTTQTHHIPVETGSWALRSVSCCLY